MVIRGDTPLKIRSVHIEGNKRTNPSVIEDELQGAYRAQTLQAVHVNLSMAAQRLQELGVFKGVRIEMQETPDKKRGETDLVVHVIENSVFSAYTGTSFTRDDVGLDGSCNIRNPTGHAETIQGSFSRTSYGSGSARLSFDKPRLYGSGVRLHAEVQENTLNMERTSSVSEVARAFNISLLTHSTRHRLSYELALRDLLPRRHMTVPFAFDASISMIKEARPSLKSSVTYRYLEDGRDDPITPSSGTLFTSSLELAGLAFGDTAHVKADVSGAAHTRLPVAGISMGVSGSVGVVQPTSWRDSRAAEGGFAAPPSTHFCDRYFLGGLPTLRGFSHAGIGPRASPREGGCVKGDSLGGDLKYSARAMLSAPLPTVQGLGIYAHVFADVANLQPWSAPLGTFVSDARVSVGAGLAANLKMARLELNYSVPVRKVKGDIEQRFQFGLAATLEP